MSDYLALTLADRNTIAKALAAKNDRIRVLEEDSGVVMRGPG